MSPDAVKGPDSGPSQEDRQLKTVYGLRAFDMDSLAGTIRQYQKYLTQYGKDLEENTEKELIRALSEARRNFEILATALYLAADGYVVAGDKEEFERYFKKIGDISDPQNLDELFKFVRFTNRMLKNANLTEIGKKSYFDYIEAELSGSK